MEGTCYSKVTKTAARYPVYQVVISKKVATDMGLERGDTVKITIEKIGTDGVKE